MCLRVRVPASVGFYLRSCLYVWECVREILCMSMGVRECMRECVYEFVYLGVFV